MLMKMINLMIKNTTTPTTMPTSSSASIGGSFAHQNFANKIKLTIAARTINTSTTAIRNGLPNKTRTLLSNNPNKTLFSSWLVNTAKSNSNIRCRNMSNYNNNNPMYHFRRSSSYGNYNNSFVDNLPYLDPIAALRLLIGINAGLILCTQCAC